MRQTPLFPEFKGSLPALSISFNNHLIPAWTTRLWQDRFKKWALQIFVDYGDHANKIDEYIFRLWDYADTHWGDVEVLVEFEHAWALGSVNQVLTYRGFDKGGRGKAQWGDAISIRPATYGDIPKNYGSGRLGQLLYWLKDSSQIKQKQITRNELKAIIKMKTGSVGFLGQVTSWKEFYNLNKDNKAAIDVIENYIGLPLVGFWRSIKNGNIKLVKQLYHDGKLAPKSKVGGVSKFNREGK